jgi:Divergent InlB B-repeat domain
MTAGTSTGRRLLFAGLVCTLLALGSPSGAFAAPPPSHWCGADETATDRTPDAVASYQVHAVYAIPADGADRFFERALPIARDLASIDSWWRLQDPTRTPRFDLHSFPGCDSTFGALDISVVRLPQPGAAYAPLDFLALTALRGDMLRAITNEYKKYAVYYDGPIAPESQICGVSGFGPIDRGLSLAFTFLNADAAEGRCGSLGSADYMAETEVHELVHNLGAVLPDAPHYCQSGHVCDAFNDLMTSSGSSNSLFDYVLDVGRDDYYGHSGSWWDVQDSAWLSHLNAPQFVLSVAVSGSEQATVESNLPGISCPPACSIPWDSGSAVSLTAQATGDRTRFSGWTGACSGEDVCLLTMDGAKSVRANFVHEWSIAVSIAARGGKGRVTSGDTIDCPAGACESLFDTGTRIVLRASPDRRSRLAGWSVPSCRSGLTCSVTADSDKQIVATFAPSSYRLTASVTGNGRVQSAPAGLVCTKACSASFPYAKPVRLTATPAAGWRFAGWSGACHGSSRCVVRLAKASTVRAAFRRA